MSNIKNKFDDLDKIYGNDQNEEIKYKPQDFVSDKDIKNNAENFVGVKNEEKKKDIYKEVYDYIDGLMDKKAKVNEDKFYEVNELDKKYDNINEGVKNSAIKNGIARSSISENILKENEDDRFNDMQSLERTKEGEIKAIDEKINNKIEERDKEFKAIEDSFLAEVEKKIEALKKERESDINSVKKYNKEIDDIRKNIGAYEFEKAISDNEKRKQQALIDEKLDVAKSYYGSMDKGEAYKMFTLDADYLKDNLKGNYEVLKKYIVDKK